MNITMEDVTKLDVMSEGKVLTASDSLSQIPVEGVSVIEVPVENFVRKNELVLSTAIGCGHSPDLFLSFVKEVVASEAAGLVISTGRYIQALPSTVLAYTAEQDFPLIEVPWEVRFSDITQAVMNEIHQWQRTLLTKSEDIHKQSLHLFMRGANLSRFAQYVQQELNAPIVLVDKNGTVTAHSPKAERLLVYWNQYILSHDQSRSSHNLLKQFSHTTLRCFQLNDHHVFQLSIGSPSQIQGYMLLFLPVQSSVDEFLNPTNERILEHAASIAGLWYQQEHAIWETETRLRGDFVWSLAQGEIDSWDVALTRAKSFHYRINLPYVCILGYPENLEEAYQKISPEHLSYEQWFASTIQYIEEQLILAAKSVHKSMMVTYQQELYVIFLEVSPEYIHEDVNRYLDQVEMQLIGVDGIVMSWGIGENHAGVKTFHESYQEAKMAFDIGQGQRNPGHRSTYKNTGNYRLLLSFSKNPEIQEILFYTIEPLLNDDQQKGMNLTGTLMTYIIHKANVSQTARELNLHRQSLLYRLRKIESLIGLSLTDTENLFLLYISLKLWDMGMLNP